MLKISNKKHSFPEQLGLCDLFVIVSTLQPYSCDGKLIEVSWTWQVGKYCFFFFERAPWHLKPASIIFSEEEGRRYIASFFITRRTVCGLLLKSIPSFGFCNDICLCKIVTRGTKAEMGPKVHEITFSQYCPRSFIFWCTFFHIRMQVGY